MNGYQFWVRALSRASGRIKIGLRPFSDAQVRKASFWERVASDCCTDDMTEDEWGEPVDAALARLGEDFKDYVFAAHDWFDDGFPDLASLMVDEAEIRLEGMVNESGFVEPVEVDFEDHDDEEQYSWEIESYDDYSETSWPS